MTDGIPSKFPWMIEGCLQVGVESGDVEDDGLSEWSFGEFTIAGDRVLLVELNWDVVKRANMSRNDLFGNHKYIVTISGIRREGTSVYYMVSDLTKAF